MADQRRHPPRAVERILSSVKSKSIEKIFSIISKSIEEGLNQRKKEKEEQEQIEAKESEEKTKNKVEDVKIDKESSKKK